MYALEHLGLVENVVCDEDDQEVFRKLTGWNQYLMCSGTLSHVRRPRFFWVSEPVSPTPWLQYSSIFLNFVSIFLEAGSLKPSGGEGILGRPWPIPGGEGFWTEGATGDLGVTGGSYLPTNFHQVYC